MIHVLRSHPIDSAARWVVERVAVRNQASAPRVKDRITVIARCLHLHVSEDRADACRDRLGRLSPDMLDELMLGPAGRQSPKRQARRRAKRGL